MRVDGVLDYQSFTDRGLLYLIFLYERLEVPIGKFRSGIHLYVVWGNVC